MSSARGAAGAVKPKLHNVNSIYAGKNQNAVRAPSVGKHGGLQSLGKTTAVVRRMPPPAILPSLRAESQGQDPNIALVPQGGSGWHRGDSNGTTADSVSITKSLSAGGLPGGATSGSSNNTGSHDLRPTWAKQPPITDVQIAAQNVNNVAALSRDFPSLAAATATVGKQSNILQNDILKPQKSGSWKAGGSCAISKNERNEPNVSQHVHIVQSHLSANSVERQLPSRYYDGTTAPPPPPSGTFQIPKGQLSNSLQSKSSSVEGVNLQSENVEERNLCTVPTTQSSTTALHPFATNVAVPPPNYSQPPPNLFLGQVQTDQMRGISAVCMTSSPVLITKDVAKSVEEGLLQQRSGHGDEGYRDSVFKNNFSIDSQTMENSLNDSRNSLSFIKDKNEKEKGYDEISNRSNDCDWQNTKYGHIDRDGECTAWHGAANVSQNVRTRMEFSQNGYGRERDDEATRRQIIERETAIERSRQKRRQISQSSVPSEGERTTSPSIYGSVRMMNMYDNETIADWDALSAENQTIDKGPYRRESQQHWNMIVNSEDRRKQEENEQKLEYRMLKRNDGRNSSDIHQNQLPHVVSRNLQDDEDDLQLTKLSSAGTKVIKRVAPTINSEQSKQFGIQSNNVQTCVSSYVHAANAANLSSGVLNPSQKVFGQIRNSTKHTISRQTHYHRERHEDGHVNEELKSDRNSSQHSCAETASSIQNHPSASSTPVITASPPIDNIWERRAEERESAERERMVQKDMAQQVHLQQHFPAVGESDDYELNNSEVFVGQRIKSSNTRHDAKIRSKKNHCHNWQDSRYSGNYNMNEYFGQEDEEEGGGLFRGQREFVNSRVSARSSRGISLGTRGNRPYGRSGYSTGRRGGSVPYQHTNNQRQQLRHNDRFGRGGHRRSRRHEPIEEVEKDNFSNMGEFHVEDTYETLSNVQKTINEEKIVGDVIEQGKSVGNDHINQMCGTRRSGSQRNTQQFYQPRHQLELHIRAPRRGGRTGGLKSDIYRNNRNAAGERNPSERNKRKKNSLHSVGTGQDAPEEENSERNGVSNSRNDTYRRGGGGNRPVRQTARIRHSSPLSLSAQSTNTDAPDNSFQKSQQNFKNCEEWETVSENSELVDRQSNQRRLMPNKSIVTRKSQRPLNGQRRENNISTSRTGNSSKNVKPASTTSHAAGRNAQPLREEVEASKTVEQPKRDACKDGLAGVDINNAGVIVIDDRPDDQVDDFTENDFEEVLSKRNKRLRQQQINEQIEAEKRKLKEKERLERRKAKIQSRKFDKKGNKEEKLTQNGANAKNSGATHFGSNAKADDSQSIVESPSQPALNTTVWNSSIVKEQIIRQISPPVETRLVIPSPIARPTPKTDGMAMNNSTKKVDMWTGLDEEQRLDASKKSSDGSVTKKNSVEFTGTFGSTSARVEGGQYDFSFDPSLQDESQPMPQKMSKSNAYIKAKRSDSSALRLDPMSLDPNDDERLKQRLDKVKDIWPGQQFTNGLLCTSTNNGSINVLEKSTNTGASSLPHGPNVAKVRPQPQTSEQTYSTVPLKEIPSTHINTTVQPPSPIACIPPGACLQSFPQVPPPAFPHYSLILNEPYNPNSAASTITQTLFGTSASLNQAPPSSRSRPASYIEQSQLFIHPPPSNAGSTWSNASAHLELLTGISATPPLSSQASTSVSRFQLSTQARSASAFAPPPPMISGNGKIAHIAPPPPHPHQVPPPLHLPPSFTAPPPDFVPSQATNFGAVGSQRATELASQNSVSGGLSRNAGPNILGQMPVPVQQPVNLSQNSQSAFPLAANAFSQAPPIHAFSAPPPPIRFPTIPAPMNDGIGVVATSWTKSSNTFPVKYTGGTAQIVPPIARPAATGRAQQNDRWTTPTCMASHYASNSFFQSHANNKEDRTHGPTPDEITRASSVSSISAPADDSLENSNQPKKATKV